MTKAKTVFACQSCGYQSAKWLGKCPDCNQWNTFAEERFEKSSSTRSGLSLGSKEDPAPIHEINTAEEGRVQCGIGEFDRVLGGGLVPGSVILIGGDPGIGKSTLLLQAVAAVSQKDITCLYVSGEESQRQIKMRAERLGVEAPNLLVLSETSLERILDHVKKIKPALLVIDSVQTLFS
ncbi:MAG: ATPase domain-containing protein, partial [Candidatus Binatia bacterium]